MKIISYTTPTRRRHLSVYKLIIAIIVKNSVQNDFKVFQTTLVVKPTDVERHCGVDMPYKLTYFDVTGLAEPIRFLMAYLDIDFEDKRIGYEHWPAVKPTMPFGKVPILEIDGQVLNQSSAIARYLARKAGLAGTDDWESMLIDIAVDNVHDFRHEIALFVFTEQKNADAETKRWKINETTEFYMEKFENTVTRNHGFFVNGKLTWADLYFVAISDTISDMAKIDILERRPNLQILKTHVLSVPQIKKWVAMRPESSVPF